MKRIALVLIACLAVLADLLAPQNFWVNQSCCRSAVSMVAPSALAFCAMPSMDAAASGRLAVEKLTCCRTTEFTVRTGSAQAVELPAALAPVAAPAVVSPIAYRWRANQPGGIARLERFPDTTGPPNPTDLCLQHTRLNL